MLSFPLPLEVKKEELENVLSAGIYEDRFTDFKQQLNLGSEKEKRELIEDITSFANEEGGYILFGIEEDRDADGKKTAKAGKARGLRQFNYNDVRDTITQILTNGVIPRIQPEICKVDGFQDGPVLIIRIPKSLNPPHMVVYQNAHRCFHRTEHGKATMDVLQIVDSARKAQTLTEKVSEFAEKRLRKLGDYGENIPVSLLDAPRIVMHFIPSSAFLGRSKDYFSRQFLNLLQNFESLYHPLSRPRPNLEGAIVASTTHNGKVDGYVQVYRNGVVESVDVIDYNYNDKNDIPGGALEEEAIGLTGRVFELYKRLQIGTPIYVKLAIINARDYNVKVARGMHPSSHVVDRDNFYLPEVVVENLEVSSAEAIKPLLDYFWQALGLPESPFYNDKGERIDTNKLRN